MKILFYSAILALAAVICSCSNNDDDNKESSKDSNAKESGYVGDFSGKEASVLFAVEAPSAGSYSITIKGRAKGSSAGTGVLTANGSDTDKHAKELEEYQTFRASVKSGIASIQAEIDALNEAFAKENAEHAKAMFNNLNTEE